MLECKICGCKFNAVEERHYISREKRVSSSFWLRTRGKTV